MFGIDQCSRTQLVIQRNLRRSPKEIQADDSSSSTSSSSSEDEKIPDKKASSPSDGEPAEPTDAELDEPEEAEEEDPNRDRCSDYVSPKNSFVKVDQALLSKLTIYYIDTDFILEDRPDFQYVIEGTRSLQERSYSDISNTLGIETILLRIMTNETSENCLPR